MGKRSHTDKEESDKRKKREDVCSWTPLWTTLGVAEEFPESRGAVLQQPFARRKERPCLSFSGTRPGPAAAVIGLQ